MPNVDLAKVCRTLQGRLLARLVPVEVEVVNGAAGVIPVEVANGVAAVMVAAAAAMVLLVLGGFLAPQAVI